MGPDLATDGEVRPPPAPAAGQVQAVYEAHAEFVYRSLARLGVRTADLPDLTHDVFIVVHEKVEEGAELTNAKSFLFAIAMRLAAGYRRRAFRKREHLMDAPPEQSTGSAHDPEQSASARQAGALLTDILDTLPVELRVAFVMFEVEGLPCPEIAETVGWPLGTVYTRVRNARAKVEAALTRTRAKERRLEGAR
ncbi:MAG: sigma-70 family RNA polymerase sigma factor [Deltaproteobacteria bacterium]|nr:sigma-70 family RNA polymerase sigma factor [Deltaproteobacteria bacterium]